MSREEFEKRLYISYLDEVQAYSFKNHFYNVIVSMTTTKKNYIENIEKSWSDLRRKYKVTDGVCLHFTDIKALLNPHYFTRPEKDRNLDMEKIFCNESQEVDKDKLFEFYTDILKVINANDFVIIATGQRFVKNPMLVNKNIRKLLHGSWYPIFKEHLDKMAYYMIHLSYQEHLTSGSLNWHMTKLRCDGDFNLSVRNDFRDAFSHVISNGTKRFNDDAVKECFDEIRFIDKTEIGFCVDCQNGCNTKLVSHAGNEIIDFITVYVGRNLARNDYINDTVTNSTKTQEEAIEDLDKLIKIHIKDKPDLIPFDFIQNKIFTE